MYANYKFFLVILLVFLASCKNPTATKVTKKTPISVETAKVAQNDIKEYLTFNGVTKFQRKEKIRSNVTGYISRMDFNIGDAIKSVQSFAYVRTKEQDALAEAVKIDSSLAKFSSPLRINSNSSGVISELNVQKNAFVTEGDILAIISQPKSLVIQVNVPFEYNDYIKIGTPCDIILQNDETMTAKISGKLPIIDPVAQSQTFLIALPNQNLPENLNVLIKTIYREAQKALTIPHIALQTNELLTDFWVMKVINDTLAIKEKVTPLLRNDSLVQIESPHLKLNDVVVTIGSYQMQDSTLVSSNK